MTNENDRISMTPKEYLTDVEERFQREVHYIPVNNLAEQTALQNRRKGSRKQLFNTTQVGSVPHDIVERREPSRSAKLLRSGKLAGKVAATASVAAILVQSNGGVHGVTRGAETLPAHIATLFTGPETTTDNNK